VRSSTWSEAPAATTTISLIESVVRARNPAFLSENHRANSPNDRQLHLKFDKTMSNSSLKARVDFFLPSNGRGKRLSRQGRELAAADHGNDLGIGHRRYFLGGRVP
jgi:hypothetical protein